MFQLINNSLSQAGKWQHDENRIDYLCTSFPEQSQFITCAEEGLNKLGAQISDIANGIERAQVHFVYQQRTYILCFEQTCEAIWIEGIGETNPEALVLLFHSLSADLQ